MKFSDIAEKCPASGRECAAEFLGTFMLVFTVGCNVLTGIGSWAVLSIAAVLAVMVYALGPVSGANLNPAVSVALGASGKMQWEKVGAYAAVQVLAGLLAGVFYALVFGKAFTLHPTSGHFLWQAGLAEIVYTFMLCTVVLNVAASNKHGGKNEFYGLAIGGVIVAGGYSGGSISMGCFNPAVAIGIDVSSGGGLYCLAYLVFELIGAALAAVAFKFCRPEDFDASHVDSSYSTRSKLLAEFLGVFILMFTAHLDVVSGATAGVVLSIAAALTCMIFALGSVSGGHFNPAVTLAAFLTGNQDAADMPAAGSYVGAQVGGAVAAALLAMAENSGASFPLGPVGAYSWVHALGCEIIFTFILVFVVISATSKDSSLKQFTALAVGGTVICGGLAAGGVSGGVLNPAVSTGIALTHAVGGGGFFAFLALFPYFLAELAGGGLAAFIFKSLHPEKASTPKLGASWLPFYGSSSSS